MLMQFCKGAGCIELAGMQAEDKRSNYTLYRPLLHLDKQELLSYLHEHTIHYFEDESNKDEKYKRNSFRKYHTQPLLEQYREGIKRSFAYLDEDCDLLVHESELHQVKELAYFKNPHTKRSAVRMIDRYLKSKGSVISAYERALLKEQESAVLGRKWVVSFMEKYIFIAPFVQGQKMDKKIKEKMRLLRLEPKLRPYLASEPDLLVFVSDLLQ
jgi:tRNA(Ile)-lysidine synthase